MATEQKGNWNGDGAYGTDPTTQERNFAPLQPSAFDANPNPLRAFFEIRFATLQVKDTQWGKLLPRNDWRMKLLKKALFSTWADLHSLPPEQNAPVEESSLRLGIENKP